ncbi:hypothetical protein Pelo_18237 [Pelomyxa schiedti]|nr:hypothetical protein Pelo_18237 [Pelomyxa schiedti]
MVRRSLEGDDQFVGCPGVLSELSELLPQAQQSLTDVLVAKSTTASSASSSVQISSISQQVCDQNKSQPTATETPIRAVMDGGSNQGRMCIECDERPRNICLHPCGHTVLCSDILRQEKANCKRNLSLTTKFPKNTEIVLNDQQQDIKNIIHTYTNESIKHDLWNNPRAEEDLAQHIHYKIIRWHEHRRKGIKWIQDGLNSPSDTAHAFVGFFTSMLGLVQKYIPYLISCFKSVTSLFIQLVMHPSTKIFVNTNYHRGTQFDGIEVQANFIPAKSTTLVMTTVPSSPPVQENITTHLEFGPQGAQERSPGVDRGVPPEEEEEGEGGVRAASRVDRKHQ